MAAEFKVAVGEHIPGFIAMMSNQAVRQAFPKVLGRLNDLAKMYQETWRRYAQGAPIPGCPRVVRSRGPYAKSIQVDLSNDVTKVIFTNYPAHKYIEEGHGEIDLKPGLIGGPKARSSSKGTTYNIVAFRHDTPKASGNPMPVNIYNIVKGFEQSKVTGTFPDAKGIIRRTYNWGNRLGPAGPQETKKISDEMQKRLSAFYGTSVSDTYTWKAGKYAGMVRMQANTTKAKSSSYITFRVVSSRSDPASWIVPEASPIPIRQAVVDTMRPITDQAIADAFEEDIARKQGVDI